MALSVADLAVHLRISADPAAPLPAAHETVLEQLLATARQLVTEAAPDAPDALADQAVIQLCGYMHEAPTGAAGAGFAAVMRNSGALSILGNHVIRRAVIVGED